MRELLLMKWGAVAALFVGVITLLWLLAQDAESLPRRYTAIYLMSLERRLNALFLRVDVRLILLGQLIGTVVIGGAGLALGSPYLCAAVALPILGPTLYLENKRRHRVQQLEAKMDGFILTLVNSLKVTPNIGKALSFAQPVLAYPMSDEIQLVLAEMRVGTSLEQALLNMTARVQSLELDAALAGILIGRKVGGDITKILENMASTLREVARLRGVVRTKTAEGKAQLWVLAVFPLGILFLFDTVTPGYFNPLTQSFIGWIVIVFAVVLWVGSLAMARKVLAVQI